MPCQEVQQLFGDGDADGAERPANSKSRSRSTRFCAQNRAASMDRRPFEIASGETRIRLEID